MRVIEVENGRLRGSQGAGAFAFRGIPYAAPTGGLHRFQAPRPAPRWAGVRDALVHGDRCPQSIESFPESAVFSWYPRRWTFSEDCCVLNVFSPDLEPSERLPVIFYVHGGGYASGGSDGGVLDGSTLAAYGRLVVVTVNHRLNLCGYTNLTHLDAAEFGDAANAGHLDLVAALEWVKRNIAAFGGDPDNVTLCGQSGGGNKVLGLLTMPAARGLFRRGINMSGASGFQLARPSHTEPYVDAMLRELAVRAGDLRRLQQMPLEALQRARNQAMTAVRFDGAQPEVDGRDILASPFTAEGLALHESVPLLLGTTDTDATLHLGRDMRNFAVDEAQLRKRVRAQFGMDDASAARLIASYREEAPGRDAAEVLCYLTSDVLSRRQFIRAAEAKAAMGRAPVYLYTFTWRVPQDGGIWRTPHTADIPFAFGTVEHARAMTGPGPVPIEIARNLMSAFAAFARSGSPSNPRMPEWKPYDRNARATMVVDEHCRLVDDYRGIGRVASAALPEAAPMTMLRGPLFRGVT